MSSIDIQKLQESLCNALCASVRLEKFPDGDIYCIQTPFYFPDGDPYQIYMETAGTDHLRLSDKGHLLMQMSYEMNVDSIFKGNKELIRTQILGETGIKEDRKRGEFYLVSPIDKLSESIFIFGQALTRIYDILLLNRSRVSSSFQDDLWEAMVSILGEHKLQRDYLVKEVDKPDLYPVDIFFAGKHELPVYMFGINNQAKSRLSALSLEHFNVRNLKYDSLLVFENQGNITRSDQERLLNAGGDFIPSFQPESVMEDSILRREVLAKAA